MKFDKYISTERLRPYVRYFVVSENAVANEYKVLPSSGLVMGFQYKGHLATVNGNTETRLASAGITGVSDHYKNFKSASDTGTILVYFTEVGFAHFASHPANELFNISVSLADIFDESSVTEVEEKLAHAVTDNQRIKVVERFLLSQVKDSQVDKLIVEAVKLIYQSRGSIRIKELNKILCISQSPFEKRFRRVVGTTPKRFASIVRFNMVVDTLGDAKSLTDICYENKFFDQAHFIKDFKQFTGDTPQHFKRFL